MRMNQRILYTKLASYYDFLAPANTETECEFLDEIFKKFGGNKISKILDLGCGTGRHSCILSRMGYKMTGIDLSEEMLKGAKSKCPEVNFKKMNFTKLEFPKNSFDASICMWSTIGYILNEEEFKTFVKNIHLITKFLLVLDSSNYENPRKIKLKEIGEKIIDLPKLKIKNEYTRIFSKTTRIRKEAYHYELFENGKKTTFLDKNRLRMWTLSELIELLKPEFEVLKVYGNYSLKERFIKSKSERKIIVAKEL